MKTNIKDKIIELLREVRYHPDFIKDIDQEISQIMKKLVEESKGKQIDFNDIIKGRSELACELLQKARDSTLMKKEYFMARVEFLYRIAQYAQKKNKISMLDDGCGSGVDLYCLRYILGDKVSLNGVDPNKVSLSLAKSRNPEVTTSSSTMNKKFDIVYNNFFSIGENTPVDWKMKSREYDGILEKEGIVMLNVDHYDSNRALFRAMMNSNLKFIKEELLQKVTNNPNCYLMVWKRT